MSKGKVSKSYMKSSNAGGEVQNGGGDFGIFNIFSHWLPASQQVLLHHSWCKVDDLLGRNCEEGKT